MKAQKTQTGNKKAKKINTTIIVIVSEVFFFLLIYQSLIITFPGLVALSLLQRVLITGSLLALSHRL